MKINTRPSKKRLRRILALSLAALVPTILVAGNFVKPVGARVDSQTAFFQKADKFLKLVRQAVNDDRALATKGLLRKENSEIGRLSRIVAVESHDNVFSVDVAVRLTAESDSELRAAGFVVAARVGDMATLRTDTDRLPELASLSSVQKLFASVYRHPVNDRARQAVEIENSLHQRVVSQTGRGVVVGIIDTGIDFRHLDFTLPGSNGRQTRIKDLLDMTVYGSQTPDPSWTYSLPGQSALIGHLYSEADLNAALLSAKPADQNSDSVKQRDKNGHGTHVAGTAAGNGLSFPSVGIYAGMAPEADLIIVKASRQNDGSDNFRTTDIINALQFIQQKAAELNEPFVINMSFGGQLGSHDGTGPDERAIDNLVNNGSGRVVCVAAGNEGDSNVHALATVPTGGNLSLDFSATSAPQFIDLYQANADRFTVTVRRPDGVSLGPVFYDPNGFSFPNGQASDQYLQIFNANDDKGDSDPSNDQPDIFLVFKAGAPNGTWTITLHDADANANLPFDAWAVGNNVAFQSFIDNNSHLVASPGTARGAITVGAFVTRSAILRYGAFTPYTSPGPTADGRLKPEVEAPGHYLYSAKSTDITSQGVVFVDQLPSADPDAAIDYVHYGGLLGTSMATAATTGAVALFLESNPTLSDAQIKDSIENSTQVDPFTGLLDWDPKAGFGQLNIAAAIQLGGRPVYRISGHVSNPPIGLLMNLTGSRTEVTSLDNAGNYSFRRLPALGTYTVTPSTFPVPYQYTFSPPSYTFANLSANQVADFVVRRLEYSVSGFIRDEKGVGVSGVQVTSQALAPDAVIATTDANGYYLLANLPAGLSYVVAPFHSDYLFTPDQQTIASLDRDETINFTATRLYKIAGRIADRNGKGISDVFVTAFGPTARSSTSDSDGNYRLWSLLPGTYMITLFHSDYVFEPTDPTFDLTGDQTVNFLALRKYYISGRVVNTAGVGVARFSLSLSGTRSRDALTFADGYYIFNELPEGGTFTVTPSGSGFIANPSSLTFTNLGGNITNANFVVANPIDDARTFVRQHYLDFLNREPDQGGWDYWTGRITECGSNVLCVHQRRIDVSAAFFIELEFQETGYVVYRLHRAAFGTWPNAPTRANLTFTTFMADRSQLVAGPGLPRSTIDFANNFVQRPEFKQAYPDTMTSTEFVNKLFDTANLTPFTQQRQDAINALTNGSKTRAQVLLDLIEIPEFKAREFNQAFVLMQYFGYLRRDADQDGYDFWLNVLNDRVPNNLRAMVCAFLTSAEYQQRFGTSITRTNRDCAQ